MVQIYNNFPTFLRFLRKFSVKTIGKEIDERKANPDRTFLNYSLAPCSLLPAPKEAELPKVE